MLLHPRKGWPKKWHLFCSLFILQVLETDQVTKRIYEVTSQLEQALANIPFNELDVSDEVREQVQFHFLTKTILFFLNEDCIVNYLIQIGWRNGNYLTWQTSLSI